MEGKRTEGRREPSRALLLSGPGSGWVGGVRLRGTGMPGQGLQKKGLLVRGGVEGLRLELRF